MPTDFKNIEKFCLCCGKRLKLNNTRDINRKNFCSRECNGSYLLKELWKNEDYVNKIKETSSKSNPKKASRKFTIPIVNCNNCGKEIRKIIGKSGLIYCSKSCYNEYRKINIVSREDNRKKISLVCNICGKEYERHPSIAKKSKYCSIQCHNIGNFLNMPRKDTKIEIIVENILKDLKIKYEKQKPISNKTVPDFFVNPNIAIYVDGCYWHSLEFNKDKDIKINEYLKNNGYKVIRYNENEIKDNTNNVREDIKNQIKNNQ